MRAMRSVRDRMPSLPKMCQAGQALPGRAQPGGDYG